MSGDGLRAANLRAAWRDLVERRMPEAARSRPDWPVRLDHCFARILLDNALGRPWREAVRPPAWRNTPAGRLAAALALGEAVLAGGTDLAALNRRSLALRNGRASSPPPSAGEGQPPRKRGQGEGPFSPHPGTAPLPRASRLPRPPQGGFGPLPQRGEEGAHRRSSSAPPASLRDEDGRRPEP